MTRSPAARARHSLPVLRVHRVRHRYVCRSVQCCPAERIYLCVFQRGAAASSPRLVQLYTSSGSAPFSPQVRSCHTVRLSVLSFLICLSVSAARAANDTACKWRRSIYFILYFDCNELISSFFWSVLQRLRATITSQSVSYKRTDSPATPTADADGTCRL